MLLIILWVLGGAVIGGTAVPGIGGAVSTDQIEESDKPPRAPLPGEALDIRYKIDVI